MQSQRNQMGGQFGNLASDAKPGGQKYRQQRVRSQLG
jgi:hypothetical protein